MVVGRVHISTAPRILKLVEPNPISFHAVGERVTSVRARWIYYVGNAPHPANEDDTVLPFTYDSSGAVLVSVIPLKLGKAQLVLFVTFADGGVERVRVDVQVDNSEQPPERLVIASGGIYNLSRPVLPMDLSDRHKTIDVDPVAIYKNVSSPVPLRASDVTFKFINSPEAAAEIDRSTGIVTARHVGQALLETSFKGVSTLTCIDVMNDIRLGRRSSCEKLLPPGRSLPPSLRDLDSTPPPRVKR
jgi:hypothetical protein